MLLNSKQIIIYMKLIKINALLLYYIELSIIYIDLKLQGGPTMWLRDLRSFNYCIMYLQ